jgi:hypothetical protein
MPAPGALPDRSYDAVVVVPGIMGSILVDRESGDTLWGFKDLMRYSRLWLVGSDAKRLHATPEEQEGRYGRVVPGGIIRSPVFAPIARGFEPYTKLVERLQAAVVDPSAVLEFSYDWRLPVEHNARCLARAARAHLDGWRGHEAHKAPPAREEPRLIIVAHSMGGLLARALSLVEGVGDVPVITDDIRRTITLGTPFGGSVKSTLLLQSGVGTPVPFAHEKRIRELARTLPGVYDLLPMYRCVEEGDEVRRFSKEDAERIGGKPDLAEVAIRFNERLRECAIPGHRPTVGTHQPTLQSLRFKNGLIDASYEDFEWSGDEPARGARGELLRRQVDGDETVSRDAARFGQTPPFYLAQQHGSLAKSKEALDFAYDVIRERVIGDRQAAEQAIGIELPDVVPVGERWPLVVHGVAHPHGVRCQVVDLRTQNRRTIQVHRGTDGMEATIALASPGLFRVEVQGGGLSAVTQLVLAADG